MEKLSSVCTCGHRLREHRADIESCEICDCEKFTAETSLEKLRAAFNGSHMGADRDAVFGDYQHDAVMYVTSLEHRLVQVTAIAQINIDAGRECKKELAAARWELDDYSKTLVRVRGELEAARNELKKKSEEFDYLLNEQGELIKRQANEIRSLNIQIKAIMETSKDAD